MIRVVCRSYGGENFKSRPPYYNKTLALASLVRAAQGADTDVVYLNDGPIPEPRRAVMEATGVLVQLDDEPLGMRASYRAALTLPDSLGWSDDDVVFFSEDDYLYHPDAMRALSAASQALSGASYFALYGSTPRHHNQHEFPHGYTVPQDWTPQPEVVVDGHRWVNTVSTTSTFGARLGALRQDRWVFAQCMVPFKTRLLDHETCLMYQAYVPYRGAEVLRGRAEEYPATAWGLLRRLGLAPFRVAMNAHVRLRRTPPHWLYAADPNLACHLETPVMTPGRDWAALADDVAAWAWDALGVDVAHHQALPPDRRRGA